MKKRILAALLAALLSAFLFLPATVSARAPEIMRSLRSQIQTYGPIRDGIQSGSDIYKAVISYEKSRKRFLFQCTYTNGRSNSRVRMYMPVSRKQAFYTVWLDQTIRSAGKTAKLSGSAVLKRKTYSDQSSTLRFSRRNKTAVSGRITNSAYQAAGNSLLKIAFKLWERGLENSATLCFRNFGFSRITVLSSNVYTYEW